MTDKLIILSLINGEKVIGIVKKEYADGGFLLSGARIVIMNTSLGGVYLEPYLYYAEDNDYMFSSASIVTTASPVSTLIGFYYKQGDKPKPGERIFSRALASDLIH